MEALLRKYEQLLDAEEHNTLTPKQMEQMNTTLKGIRYLGIEVPMRMLSMVAKLKGTDRVADITNGMHAPMFRTFLGLPVLTGRSER